MTDDDYKDEFTDRGGLKHIEMYDGQTFCEACGYEYDGVHQNDWHHNPAAVLSASCRRCLSVIVTLADFAKQRLITLRSREQ